MTADNNKTHEAKSLDNLINSTCSILSRLLARPLSTITLPEQPSLSEVRHCGESGCVYCQLIWDGVSSIFPGFSSWNDTKGFGFTLHEGSVRWLRIGIAFVARDVVRGFPREWIDFHWLPAEGMLFMFLFASTSVWLSGKGICLNI